MNNTHIIIDGLTDIEIDRLIHNSLSNWLNPFFENCYKEFYKSKYERADINSMYEKIIKEFNAKEIYPLYDVKIKNIILDNIMQYLQSAGVLNKWIIFTYDNNITTYDHSAIIRLKEIIPNLASEIISIQIRRGPHY